PAAPPRPFPRIVMKSLSYLSFFLCLSPLLAAEAERLSTATLVGTITAQNPELKFYEAEIAAAKSAARFSTALPDPELSCDGGRKRVRSSNGTLAGEGVAWTVSVTQTFEWPGRLALRKSIANRDVELAELGLARFRAALAARTRLLAYGLYSANARSTAL